MALVAAGGAWARDVPALTTRVTDQARALSSSDVARIEQKLASYEQSTGHQLAVLIIPSLDGDVLEQYALKVAEAWRLGDKKRDDGALLLIAMSEHKIRIEVGYGLEGAIPDVTASRIIRDIMAPKMRENDVAGAVDAGTDALMKAAQGENIGAPPPVSEPPPRGVGWIGIGLFLLLWAFGMPRFVRVPILAVAGGLAGAFVLSNLTPFSAIGGAILGIVLGIILPVARGRSRNRSGGFWMVGGPTSGGGSWGSSSSSSGGGGGGFSGGGGSFGGGGASGGW